MKEFIALLSSNVIVIVAVVVTIIAIITLVCILVCIIKYVLPFLWKNRVNIFGILVFVVIFGFFVGASYKCRTEMDEDWEAGLRKGDFVRITKPMSEGYGKIAVVEESRGRSSMIPVKYITSVEYHNEEKTKWTRKCSEKLDYDQMFLELIPKENIIEVEGYFIDKTTMAKSKEK